MGIELHNQGKGKRLMSTKYKLKLMAGAIGYLVAGYLFWKVFLPVVIIAFS